MEAMPDPVVSGEDNPSTRAYVTQPFHIAGLLAEMISVHLDYGSCLPEGFADFVHGNVMSPP
jgi:hypothetical protein